MKNIFYFDNINVIGGIETFFYEMAKKYCDHDITILYSRGDINQIRRLKQLVRVEKHVKGTKYVCEKAFFNFNLGPINDITAKEYYSILHGDYAAMGIKPPVHPKINGYIGISHLVCDSFKKLTGLDSECIYNPIQVDKPKRILNLISATRLTEEKGKGRMEKFAKILDDAKIPYLWLVFTNDTNAIENPNIIYMKPRLDIRDYIANADYLVQLSDNEGYCYSIVESLCLNTPVIATDMPVLRELGVNETNSFILDFDLVNVPVNEIYTKEFNFSYSPKEDAWIDYLAPGESTYTPSINLYKVEALDTYTKYGICDTELDRVPLKGEQWLVDELRLSELTGNNPLNKIFVKLC